MQPQQDPVKSSCRCFPHGSHRIQYLSLGKVMDLSVPTIDPAPSRLGSKRSLHLDSPSKEIEIQCHKRERREGDWANKERNKIRVRRGDIADRFCAEWVWSWPSNLGAWCRLCLHLGGRWQWAVRTLSKPRSKLLGLEPMRRHIEGHMARKCVAQLKMVCLAHTTIMFFYLFWCWMVTGLIDK